MFVNKIKALNVKQINAQNEQAKNELKDKENGGFKKCI